MYKIAQIVPHPHSLHVPWPLYKKNTESPYMHGARRLLPIFIPFAGCAQRCIFCAQDIQSGRSTVQTHDLLSECEAHILQHRARHRECELELAFFGGTFTALSPDIRTLCCDFVRTHRDAGHIHSARCSTRPDALTGTLLDTLWSAGFRTIELGIQSFHDDALCKAQRHYSGDTARRACDAVTAHGFHLGVQLMPGMPGVDAEIFLSDVRTALSLKASFMRFYPCQVIKNTQLAQLWQQGHYSPWNFDDTVIALRDAWLLTEACGVPVIRMGLAPEAGLEEHILAGPRHPCLGSIVQSEALYAHIVKSLAGRTVRHAHLPRRCQGYFWGHKKHLAPRWQALGIVSADKKSRARSHITWHQGDDVILYLTSL